MEAVGGEEAKEEGEEEGEEVGRGGRRGRRRTHSWNGPRGEKQPPTVN